MTQNLTTETIPPQDPTDGAGPDTAMKERAQGAKDEGLKVASTAKDEAMNVVGESRRQASDLLHEATGQLQEQAAAQKGKAAEGLRALGEELASMAQGADAGPAADLAHQASEKVTALAGWLDQHDPNSLLDETRRLAQRKPGQFLLGAAAAGLLAGRVTRGAQGAAKSDDGSPPSPQQRPARPRAVEGSPDPMALPGSRDGGPDRGF